MRRATEIGVFKLFTFKYAFTTDRVQTWYFINPFTNNEKYKYQERELSPTPLISVDKVGNNVHDELLVVKCSGGGLGPETSPFTKRLV